MFKNKQIENQKQLVMEAEKWFEHMASQTNNITFDTIQEVCWRKAKLECVWEVALKDDEVQDMLFQLLMHKQYVAYLAEDLRQKTAELLRLQGISITGLDREQYTKLVEKKAGSKYMREIFDDFIKQIIPSLETFEHENS